MNILLTTFLAVAAATPALAAPAASDIRTVTAEERVIPYTVQTATDGSYVLVSAPRAPSDFRLRVRNGWVYGHVDGKQVAFRAPAAKADRIAD